MIANKKNKNAKMQTLFKDHTASFQISKLVFSAICKWLDVTTNVITIAMQSEFLGNYIH